MKTKKKEVQEKKYCKGCNKEMPQNDGWYLCEKCENMIQSNVGVPIMRGK
jgi:predicted amidophosphoribosyltransferase